MGNFALRREIFSVQLLRSKWGFCVFLMDCSYFSVKPKIKRFGATVLLKVPKNAFEKLTVMSLSTTHVVICFYATHSPPKVGVWPANMRVDTISADVLSRCPTTSLSSQINACFLWHGGAVGRCSFIKRRNGSRQDFWKQMLLLFLFRYIFLQASALQFHYIEEQSDNFTPDVSETFQMDKQQLQRKNMEIRVCRQPFLYGLFFFFLNMHKKILQRKFSPHVNTEKQILSPPREWLTLCAAPQTSLLPFVQSAEFVRVCAALSISPVRVPMPPR